MAQHLSGLAFEVMDREPTLTEICLLFGALGASGLLLGLWKRWLTLVPLAASVFFAWVLYAEVNDPYVRPALVSEAGVRYVRLSYVAMSFGIVLPVVGFFAGSRRQGHSPTANGTVPIARKGDRGKESQR